MPLKTPIYGLTAFVAGDTYNSAADQNRFTIIDNEMAFISDQIGDGLISGWALTNTSGLNVRLNPGIGMIDKFITQTYGNIDFSLKDNSQYYVYLVRKSNTSGTVGPVSEMKHIQYVDIIAPTQVLNLTHTSTFNSVTLSWNANSEVDVAFYNIYQSSNNITFSKVATSILPTYKVTGLIAQTTYYFKVSAQDYSGNEGIASTTNTVITNSDTTVPVDPSSVQIFPGNGILQLFWNPSIGTIDHYKATITAVDTEGNAISSPFTETAPANQLTLTIPSLTNGQQYKVTLQSVSASGINSNGITVIGVPAYHPGPDDPVNLVITDLSVDSSGKVGLNIQWDANSNPYGPAAVYYMVTISILGGESGDASIYTSNNITITAYTATATDGISVIRPILEKTEYIIQVQSVDSSGDASRGTLGRIITRSFRSPATVSNLSFIPSNNTSLKIVWNNSISDFSYNLISLNQVDLATFGVNTILLDQNIGATNIYNIPNQYAIPNTRFDVSVQVVDSYGNVSHIASASYVVSQIITIDDKPPVPLYQDARGGNNQITLVWSPPDTSNFAGSIAQYNIWRAPYQINYVATDFTSVGKVPFGKNAFIDYTAQNDSRYVYFMTSISSDNVESDNPVDDNFFSYPLVTALATNHTDLTSPDNLVISPSVHNVNLTWSFTADNFDGYEILRSDGNVYSFKTIGVASVLDSGFTDVNALLKAGTYYYMVRKFRNDADVLISKTNIQPVASILIGIVTVANSAMTFDQSALINILNMHDPISNATKAALNVPHHLYFSDTLDHRIELSVTLTVDNWTTQDFTQYNTTTDISFTNNYVVYVDGVQTSMLTDLDRVTGTLTFQNAIFDSSTNNTEPSVTVLFLNVPEVEGKLPAKLTGPFSAQQITRGTLDPALFTQLNHSGRINESITPVSNLMTTRNGFSYSVGSTVGTSTVYYDVIQIAADSTNFLAATSQGIKQSVNAGTEWNTVFTPPAPVTRLFYSHINDIYLALTPTAVYKSNSLFTSWSVVDGMININATRDVIEDYLGNIYVSTDKGVYRYKPGEFTKDIWSQTSVITVGDSNTYAMRVDGGSLYVSTNSGIYISTDGGINWTRSSSFNQNSAIHSFCYVGSTIFALSNDRLWRLRTIDPTYTQVAIFPDFCRKMQFFNNELYVSCNAGIFTTPNDLYADAFFKMNLAFETINRNGRLPKATSLNAIESRLFVGTEAILYSSSTGTDTFVQDESPQTVTPTITIDGVEQQIGVYWNVGSTSLYFDAKVDPTSNVEIINNYSVFFATDGGWADANYQAPVTVVVNTNQYQSKTQTLSISDFGSIALPDFNQRNSNFIAATNAYNVLIPYLNGFTDRANQEVQYAVTLTVTAEAVAQMYSLLEAFRLCLYPDLQKQIVVPPISVTFARTVPTLKANDTLNIVVTADATSGKFTFTPQLDKYDAVSISIQAVPIQGQGSNTHDQVEDALEKINSGLTAGLSRVQQTNLLRLGIRNERKNPGDLAAYSGAYQSVISTPCSENWYDSLNSTIDYESISEVDENGVSAPYPACVSQISLFGEVWIGSVNSIIAVNTTDFSTRTIDLPTTVGFQVKSIYTDNVSVYIFTSEGLFVVDSGGNITKDVDLELLNNTSSLIVVRQSYVVSTPDGLYTKKSYDLSWTKVLDVQDAFISPSTSFIFCSGKDPNQISDSLCFTSVDGLTWSSRTSLPNIITNAIARRSYLIFFATTSGLYLEDLSRLMDPNNTLPVIQLVDLLNDTAASAVLNFNDVCADNTRVAIAAKDGTYWVYDSDGNYTQYDSGLGVIHKILIVDGKIWAFGKGMIQIENNARTIRVSTGAALL